MNRLLSTGGFLGFRLSGVEEYAGNFWTLVDTAHFIKSGQNYKLPFDEAMKNNF
jgi:hypothetical protein